MRILLLYGTKHLDGVEPVVRVLEKSKDEVWLIDYKLEADEKTLAHIKDNYDLIISYYYPYVLPKEILEATECGAINCHPSLLPFNRGVHTNVWPIVDCTPAGVTIHKMEEKLDSGNIIAQREVDVTDFDTGESLYRRLAKETELLFCEIWPALQAFIYTYGCLPEGTKQDETNETFHRIKDLSEIQDLSSYFTMSEMTTIREFIDITRACTFDGYRGAYITNEDGEKVYYSLTPYKVDE